MIGAPSLNWYFDEEARRREEELLAGWAELGLRRAHPVWVMGVRLLVIAALLVVLGALVREYFVWETARMRTLLARSVEMDAWLWQQKDFPGLVDRLDPQARPDWVRWYNQFQLGRRNWAAADARLPQVEIGDVTMVGRGLALVEVRYRRPETPDRQAYREHQAYRHRAGEWLRTSPPLDWWGAVQILETPSFYFRYTERDAPAVEAVAAAIEEVRREMRARLGLPEAKESSPLTVIVEADQTAAGAPVFSGRRLVLLTPVLARTRLLDDATQALSRPLFLALSRQITEEAIAEHPFTPRWAGLFEASQAWLAREVNPFLPPDARLESGALQQYAARNGLPRLEDLHELRYAGYFWWAGWASTSLESLVAYTMNTCGADKFDDLVYGLSRYATWDDLSQDLCGVPAATLEAGWHTYLRQRYLQAGE